MAGDLGTSDPSAMMAKSVASDTSGCSQLILDKLTVGETIEQIIEANAKTNTYILISIPLTNLT